MNIVVIVKNNSVPERRLNTIKMEVEEEIHEHLNISNKDTEEPKPHTEPDKQEHQPGQDSRKHET